MRRRDAICTFRIHPMDGPPFEIREKTDYTTWEEQQNRLHLWLIPTLYEQRGFWDNKTFYPWHRIASIEWLATEPLDKYSEAG
jgi:hypothetical protein